ncbi:hypothetical protein JTB14_031708 [Gonioctena quinquepunctata]|nr:hypothetical protein JTB14_031708 [Gonioctena quinquepunctata]
MKLVVFLCIFTLVISSHVKVPRQALVQELLRKAPSVEELVVHTKKLIDDTIVEMNRYMTSGRNKLNKSWKALEEDLEEIYQSAKNRTDEVVTYLLDDIEKMKGVAEDAESCSTSLEPYISNLKWSFDEQLQVIYSTWKYRANTTIENNYTSVSEKVSLVEALKTTLTSCKLDEDCIVNVADAVVKYNLGLMNGLNFIYDNFENVHQQAVTGAMWSTATTLYAHEEYACNVAKIIEECIQSRIDVPVLTTTTPRTTSTTPVTITTETTEWIKETTEDTTTEGTTTETIASPTSTRTPKIYCTHQAF